MTPEPDHLVSPPACLSAPLTWMPWVSACFASATHGREEPARGGGRRQDGSTYSLQQLAVRFLRADGGGIEMSPEVSGVSVPPISFSTISFSTISFCLGQLAGLAGPASLFPPHRPAWPSSPPLVIALALTLSPFRLPCQRVSMCASMNEPVRRCARVRESNACLHWCASMNEPVRHCTRPFMHKQTTYRRETSKG